MQEHLALFGMCTQIDRGDRLVGIFLSGWVNRWSRW